MKLSSLTRACPTVDWAERGPRFHFRPRPSTCSIVANIVATHGSLLTQGGVVLKVETTSEKESEAVDTYIRLLDRGTRLEIGYNDDGGDSPYSALTHTAAVDQEFLIQLTQCCTSPFAPRSQFNVRVSLLHAASIIDAGIDGTDAPIINVGETKFFRTALDRQWVGFAVPTGGLYRVRHDTVPGNVTLTDRAGQRLFEFVPSDASGTLPEQEVFVAEGGRDYLLKVGAADAPVSLTLEAIDPLIDLANEPEGQIAAIPGDASAILKLPVNGAMIEINSVASTESLQHRNSYPSMKIDIAVSDLTHPSPEVVNIQIVELPGWTRYEWPTDADQRSVVRIGLIDADALFSSFTIFSPSYDGFMVGDRVRLGRHEMIDGDDNWNPAMDKYVDCIARITRRVETDGSASLVVEVDLRLLRGGQGLAMAEPQHGACIEDTGQPGHCLHYAVG